MNPDKNRLQQESKRPTATQTPTGVRLQPLGKERELVEVSHAFQVLVKNSPKEPSPAEWREFSRNLTTRLELDKETSSLGRWAQTVRDKFIATDSLALRALGYALMLLIVLAALMVLWFGAAFTISLFEAPVAHAALEVARHLTTIV